jgi:hypothetical protein
VLGLADNEADGEAERVHDEPVLDGLQQPDDNRCYKDHQHIAAAAKEMQALQMQLKDKQADLQLKAQSEMTDAQENQAKMEIQVLELQIKQQEFQQADR